MAVPTANLCIIFADISGSTRLYELLGDAAARKTVADCLETIREVVERHGGRAVKTIGDEIMSTFEDVDAATAAACEMHEALEEDVTHNTDRGPLRLSIRVGMHFGPALVEHGDVFGDAVNVAARMVSLAKAMQIVTTHSTVELMSPILRATTRFIDRAPVRGKKETIDIYEILWQQEDVTRMSTGVIADSAPAAQLTLRHRAEEIVVSEARPLVVLGRSKTSDLCVDEALASRQHVRIECRRGKFFLIDQSTNGTYVRANGQVAYLRREEMALTGEGEISCGRPFSESSSDVVRFESDG